MATSSEIKARAKALAEKTDVNSITPKEVGGIMSDLASHSENVLRNGGTLGIRKVYESVSAMEADSTNPVDLWGNPIKKGNLVVIYDGTTTGVDNNKVYAFMNPGWELSTELDAGYVTRREITDLKDETDTKLSELGSKFLIELFDITHTPASTASLRIEIGRTLKAGREYRVIIEYDFKVGYLASIVASPTLSGNAVDTIATIYNKGGQLEVRYIPSVDVNGLYINPASNYVYNAESFVKIKIIQEATLNDIDSSVEDVKKLAEKGIDDANKKTDNVSDRISFFEELLGKNFKYSEMSAYSSIEVGFVLKKGSVIKNNGVPLIFAEDSSYNSRQDIPSGASTVLNSDKYLVRVHNIAGDVDFTYEPIETVDGKVLKDDSILGSQLKDNAVTVEKTDFFSSVNLIDINDENVVLGAYLQSWGDCAENPSYNTTGFAPVKKGVTYYIGSLDVGAGFARILGFYDKYKNKRPIQYLQNVETSFVAPEGAAYVRLTLGAGGWDKSQLTENEMKNYTPYKIALKTEYIPNGSGNGGGGGSEGDNSKDLFFYLPKDIYVAAGRTIELYYEQILLGAEKYHIQAVCSVGKSLDRKFQIIGSESKVGNHTLTINVYNDEGEYIIGGTATIHIVSSEIENSLKVLPIGDSLTNGKQWLYELSRLSSNITTVGTRQSIHEGRSGGTVSTYTNVSGSEVYSYDTYYRGRGSASELFSDSKAYSKGDIVRVASTAGNGQQGYDVYVFLEDHPSGAWNGNDVYCINKGNPFYDYNNKKFSMSFYKTFQGISYDLIMIYLGTNGISLTPETNENGALGIKTLIELIREEDTETPIVVVNTIFRSSQNGIGNQGNTDGYKAQSAYKFEEDKKVLLLAKAVEEMVSGMDGVYLCPVGFTHDSKYNFGNTHIQVNPRLTDTSEVYELQPLDSVHPQECGYLQMADEMFSTICAVD